MACLAMHLAIGKIYSNNNPNENQAEILRGSIDPDITKIKTETHYSINTNGTTIKEIDCECKVDLISYLKNNKIYNSYQKGYFLHLITDYVFYTFIYREEMEEIGYDEMTKKQYADYDCVTKYILENYNIIIPEHIKHIAKISDNCDFIFFTEKTINNFINVLSSINLIEAEIQILKSPQIFRQRIIDEINNY